MYYNSNEDLRSIKTEKALFSAMLSLLKKQNFNKITVKRICEEALISRAAFYTHFIDKYNFLKYWLTEICTKNFTGNHTYEQMEKNINNYVNENKQAIKNLLCDADDETMEILFNIILSTKNLAEKNISGEAYQKKVAVANFYAGGIISYFLWQIKNKFPSDIPLMNKAFYALIKEFKDR